MPSILRGRLVRFGVLVVAGLSRTLRGDGGRWQATRRTTMSRAERRGWQRRPGSGRLVRVGASARGRTRNVLRLATHGVVLRVLLLRAIFADVVAFARVDVRRGTRVRVVSAPAPGSVAGGVVPVDVVSRGHVGLSADSKSSGTRCSSIRDLDADEREIQRKVAL